MLDKVISKVYAILIGRYRLIDKNINIPKDCFIQGATLKGNVTIGSGVRIVGGVYISGKVKIDKYTSINGPNTDIYSSLNSVNIGRFCSIARNVSIQEYNHKVDRLSTYFINKNIFGDRSFSEEITSKGDILIGNDVWIGAHSVILSGTTIGNGAIIGANCVVSGNIPPYAIVGGSPARVLKYRFSEEIIESLLKIEWWDWDLEKLRANSELFKTRMTLEKLNDII